MTLTSTEEDEVRKRVVDRFGEDVVRQMDRHYMELNDLRIASKDSYEFLEKVREKYPDDRSELLLAAILYGMKQGELAVEYHQRKLNLDNTGKPLPVYGHAS